MTTAKTYEEIKAMLEEHGCEVVETRKSILRALEVKACDGMKLILGFSPDQRIYDAWMEKENKTLFRIKFVSYVEFWCSAVNFFNDNGYEIGFATVESSD